jgi:hypothetical protein
LSLLKTPFSLRSLMLRLLTGRLLIRRPDIRSVVMSQPYVTIAGRIDARPDFW